MSLFYEGYDNLIFFQPTYLRQKAIYEHFNKIKYEKS